METNKRRNRILVNKTAKRQVNSEFLTKEYVLKNEMEIQYLKGTPESEKFTKDEIKNTRMLFNLTGKIPHIFDAINAICTHDKDLIKNKNDNGYYYQVDIDIKKFIYYAVGEWGNKYAKDLKKEIQAIGEMGKTTATFYNKDHILICKPVLFTGIEYTKPDSKQSAICKKIMSKITILFFKDIWKSVVIDDTEHAFLYTPFALSSAMKYTINKYPELEIREHKSYRRLLLYLLNHDYSSKPEIIFNPIEMAYCCNNRLLRTKGKFRKKEAIIFLEKGIKLFQKMETEGFLDGLKIQDTKIINLQNGMFKIILKEYINSPFKGSAKRLPK